jgi:hypothetical protein
MGKMKVSAVTAPVGAQLGGVSFNDEPVVREVASLKILSQVRTAMTKAAESQKSPLSVTNKESFLLATRSSLIVLDEFAKKKGTADDLLRPLLNRTTGCYDC